VSLYRSSGGLYRSTVLDFLDWIDHAFGTAWAAPPAGYLLLKQVHSARVLNSSEWRPEEEGDALATVEPGLRLGVKTADCVSILIADPRHRAVAAVHAGWRGTAAGIARAAVGRMEEWFGSEPGELVAALGPSIGPCCYEVGPEVACLFPAVLTAGGRPAVDLRQANLEVLCSAGVRRACVDAEPPCTHCGGAEFFSWRRDKVPAQRMYSVVGLR
jgi:polyphenol oxidase